MNTIAYSSPFVPAEWIAAHGLQPRRLRLRAPDGPLPPTTRGACPYAAALVDNACKQAVTHVLATTCDQMRYAASLVERRGSCSVFLLNVPSTWQTAASRGLYRSELERLGRFFVELGGRTPTDSELARIMLAGNDRRIANGRQRSDATICSGVPLAILGGPLLAADDRFFDMVEQAGGRVALDATEDSERTAPRPFDPADTAADPFAELVDAYFDGIVDAFRRPNSRLYEWLGRELAANEVRGIILRRYLWCDLWHAELQRLRQWSNLPVLEIDIGSAAASLNRLQGRIEAFLETLQQIR
jgi:benzoyl-CoA reductase/2-hydroxyglutaryl-CoA dehydratase subunit BcrC/BadD/HgdB